MTDRKLTCAACKSAITKGDIVGSDLEFGGELKATNQPEYTAGADTDLVATIGTLDQYAPMVRTTGNQQIDGVKTFSAPQIKASSAGIDFINSNDAGANVRPETLSQALIAFRPNDGGLNALIQVIHNTDGGKWLQIQFTAENGSTNTFVICGINADGTNIVGGYR